MIRFYERHRFLILFASLSLLMGTSVGIAKVATSLYAIELNADSKSMGLIAGAQSIGILFMSLPVGILVDQFGPARLFVSGTLLAGAIYLALPLLATPLFLIGCTAAISFAMPMRFVSLNTVFMSQLETIGEARAGWYRGTHMAGMFLIGPSVAALAVSLLGHTGSFWLIAFLFGLTILISPVVFGQYRHQQRAAQPLSFATLANQLRLLRSDTDLRGACCVEFCAQAANGFFSFFVVVLAIQYLHLDATSASRLLATQGVAYIFALFMLGVPISRLDQTRVYQLCFAGVASGLMLLGSTTPFWLLSAGALLLGLSLGSLQISTLTRFARIGKTHGRGRIAGLNAMAGPTGSLLGSLAGGGAADLMGLNSAFILFAIAFMLLARIARNWTATSARA